MDVGSVGPSSHPDELAGVEAKPSVWTSATGKHIPFGWRESSKSKFLCDFRTWFRHCRLKKQACASVVHRGLARVPRVPALTGCPPEGRVQRSALGPPGPVQKPTALPCRGQTQALRGGLSTDPPWRSHLGWRLLFSPAAPFP